MTKRKWNPEHLPACFNCRAYRRTLHTFHDRMGNPIPLCGPCLDKFEMMGLVGAIMEADPSITQEEAYVEVSRRLDELTADLDEL